MEVSDKRVLNMIHKNIQFRQAALALGRQDTRIPDGIETIEGTMQISLVEAKGLLLPDEPSRRGASATGIDSYLSVTVEDSN
jgi:hypothetical protein